MSPFWPRVGLCWEMEASELPEVNLGQWFSACVPKPTATASPGKLVPNANSQAHLTPRESETLGVSQPSACRRPGRPCTELGSRDFPQTRSEEELRGRRLACRLVLAAKTSRCVRVGGPPEATAGDGAPVLISPCRSRSDLDSTPGERTDTKRLWFQHTAQARSR